VYEVALKRVSKVDQGPTISDLQHLQQTSNEVKWIQFLPLKWQSPTFGGKMTKSSLACKHLQGCAAAS